SMIAIDFIELASKAGSLPIQVLLLLGLIILGAVIRSMHRENLKKQTEFMDKMDTKEVAISQERKDRIAMLIGLIKDDVDVKARLVSAVDGNTRAIEDLKDFIREQVVITRELIKENKRK